MSHRTGTIEPYKRADGVVYYRARIRLSDKTRERVDIPESFRHDKRRSKGYAQALQEREDDSGALLAAKRAREAKKRVRVMPTAAMAVWFDAWIAEREERGHTSTRENRSHYENHIAPAIGTKHVRDWTTDDLRTLSRALDAKIRGGTMAWKTASNVWVTAGKMLTDAVKSKRDELRCRDSNPIRDVESPDRGHDRARTYLYPSEFLTFVACADVPLRWRISVAIAVYTFARAAELRALRWSDVDLDHGTIHIHRARDRVTGEDKPTKTKLARRFALESEIGPLLMELHDHAEAPDDHVLDLPSERDLARGLKRWLRKAGITRAELFTTDATRQAVRFHDLRATGITWMAVRGDPAEQIKRRAGHTDFATTEGYIREAEILRDGFGEVFPTLPIARVLAPENGNPSAMSCRASSPAGAALAQVVAQVAAPAAMHSRKQQEQGGFWRGGRGSKPGIMGVHVGNDVDSRAVMIREPSAKCAADGGAVAQAGRVAQRCEPLEN
jgi:integrase